MQIGLEHLAIGGLLITLATIVWRGGRQSHITDQTAEEVSQLWKRHEDLVVKIEEQGKKMMDYHVQRLKNDARLIRAIDGMRILIIKTNPALAKEVGDVQLEDTD